MSAWTSSSIQRIFFLKSFQKSADRNPIPNFCWMPLKIFLILPSFKKIIINDSFFFVGKTMISTKWHQLRERWKSLWIKNLTVFKKRNELNWIIKLLQCQIKRSRKKNRKKQRSISKVVKNHYKKNDSTQILTSILCKKKTRSFLKSIITELLFNFRFWNFGRW